MMSFAVLFKMFQLTDLVPDIIQLKSAEPDRKMECCHQILRRRGPLLSDNQRSEVNVSSPKNGPGRTGKDSRSLCGYS